MHIAAATRKRRDNDVRVNVPEPETYAMMLAGLGLLGFIARRRMRNGTTA